MVSHARLRYKPRTVVASVNSVASVLGERSSLDASAVEQQLQTNVTALEGQ